MIPSLFVCFPSFWVKKVAVTFRLSSKASVEYWCSKWAGAVKITWPGITCPSMTFLSIKLGRGGGYSTLNVIIIVIIATAWNCKILPWSPPRQGWRKCGNHRLGTAIPFCWSPLAGKNCERGGCRCCRSCLRSWGMSEHRDCRSR